MNSLETYAPIAVFICAAIALIFSAYQFFAVKKSPKAPIQ